MVEVSGLPIQGQIHIEICITTVATNTNTIYRTGAVNAVI